MEFSITKGKGILIASTYPLLLLVIASMSGTRSCTSNIRNWLTLNLLGILGNTIWITKEPSSKDHVMIKHLFT
jgi:hypothetical protein